MQTFKKALLNLHSELLKHTETRILCKHDGNSEQAFKYLNSIAILSLFKQMFFFNRPEFTDENIVLKVLPAARRYDPRSNP